MYDLERLGLVLQISGLLIILGSQILLWYRARKKWGSVRSLKKLFIRFAGAKVAYGKEEVSKMSKDEADEGIKKFPFAEFLYDDFVISVIGVALALIGTVFEFMG